MNTAPFEIEDFLASVVEALKVRGDARAIAVLIEGLCEFQWIETDFGIDFWQLSVGLPVRIFASLTPEERAATQSAIEEAASPFFSHKSDEILRSVFISPLVSAAEPTWRAQAAAFVRGEGVTNQGRVRSDNIASMQHNGLLFRSKAEIALFQALLRAHLAVAPLPVFVRVGKVYNRLEPDFVVVYKGLTFVVEVDGDTFHRELPAEADKRLVPLTYEGVEVRRIPASELSSDPAADAVVRDLIQFMARRKEAR